MQFLAGRKLRAGDLNYHTDTGTDAQYTANAVQTVPPSQDTRMAFGAADRTTPLVTRNAVAPGHQFVLNRAGIWAVNATVRLGSSTGGGERYCAIAMSTGEIVGAVGGPVDANVGLATTMLPSKTRWFPAGTILQVQVWQSSGANLNIDFGNAGWFRINLCWLKD